MQSRYTPNRYKGLPPGPIATPGTASVEATLYPANVPYHCISSPIPTGITSFVCGLEEHQAAVATRAPCVAQSARGTVGDEEGNGTGETYEPGETARAPRRLVAVQPVFAISLRRRDGGLLRLRQRISTLGACS